MDLRFLQSASLGYVLVCQRACCYCRLEQNTRTIANALNDHTAIFLFLPCTALSGKTIAVYHTR